MRDYQFSHAGREFDAKPMILVASSHVAAKSPQHACADFIYCDRKVYTSTHARSGQENGTLVVGNTHIISCWSARRQCLLRGQPCALLPLLSPACNGRKEEGVTKLAHFFKFENTHRAKTAAAGFLRTAFPVDNPPHQYLHLTCAGETPS